MTDKIEALTVLENIASSVEWESSRRPNDPYLYPKNRIDRLEIARAIGVVGIAGQSELWEWADQETRIPFYDLTQLKRGNEVVISVARYGQNSVNTDVHFDLGKNTWIPIKPSYVLDGQNWWEENSTDPNIMFITGRYLADYAAAQVIGGGAINFLYLWNRALGVLTLEGVNTLNLRENPKLDKQWEEVDGLGTKIVTLDQYGNFGIPTRFSEQDWLISIFFPKKYQWLDHRDNGKPKENVGYGYNFFGIIQLENWEELHG